MKTIEVINMLPCIHMLVYVQIMVALAIPTLGKTCSMELLYKHTAIQVQNDLNHVSCSRQSIAPSTLLV